MKIDCNHCLGTGTNPDFPDFDCPDCNGSGQVNYDPEGIIWWAFLLFVLFMLLLLGWAMCQDQSQPILP